MSLSQELRNHRSPHKTGPTGHGNDHGLFTIFAPRTTHFALNPAIGNDAPIC